MTSIFLLGRYIIEFGEEKTKQKLGKTNGFNKVVESLSQFVFCGIFLSQVSLLSIAE